MSYSLFPYAFAIAYLIGSIPFGLLLARLCGAGDIRKIGSGNIGATNVLRTGRKGLAAATLLLDALKGYVALIACHVLFDVSTLPIAFVAVILGHCFPLWLKFRGGKGIATSLGAVMAVSFLCGALGCLVWLGVAYVTRISSAGGLACVWTMALSLFFMVDAPLHMWAGLAGVITSLIVTERHRQNIARLLSGTEPKIGSSNPSK